MGKNKVLVKVHPEGKYVVDLDKNINMADVSIWLYYGMLVSVHRMVIPASNDPSPGWWHALMLKLEAISVFNDLVVMYCCCLRRHLLRRDIDNMVLNCMMRLCR